MINEGKIIELIKKAEEGPTIDFKEDLVLSTNGDKAEFIKDVLSLANSGTVTHILLGIEDGTGKPVGLKTTHTAEQINQILKDKCDPRVSVEYAEKTILGYQIGIIEINCSSPPYIISVTDKYGGRLSANPNKSCHIYRGTVYIRNYNINQGAKRRDLDNMYQVKYVSLQSDLQMTHEVSVKSVDDLKEIEIQFRFHNAGDILATFVYARLQFINIEKIVSVGDWSDISSFNENTPTIRLIEETPIYPGIPLILTRKTKIHVKKDVKQIETYLWLGATNMRVKEGAYVITLPEPT